MIRALIVDDEPIARRGVRHHLDGEPDIEIIGECGHGAAAIEAIAELSPDLVFLDIQMPEVSGFDVIDAIGVARMPAVIFITAFDEHALHAFDVHAIDYVLKPIDGERFRVALERARLRLATTRDDFVERVTAALETLGRPMVRRYAKRLAVKGDGRVLLLDVQEVDRVEAAGNYVEDHTGSRRHLLRETMTSLEARLDPDRFVRVSRSSIVNADRVRELESMFNGDFVVVLRDGSRVSGSRRYRRSFDSLTG